MPPLFPTQARAHRMIQLLGGLILYGFSTSLLVRAALGLDPWDVLHQGMSRMTDIPIGRCTIIVGLVVLLLWIPLKQWPGLGTVSNAILIGVVVDLTLPVIPEWETLAPRAGLLTAGILLNGLATGLYIGAGLGPGPRDGLMTGLARGGRSIRMVRTSIEIAVLAAGWLLGGSVGVGTLAYALAIGPLAHIFIPMFTVGDAPPSVPPEAHTSIP